MSELCNKENHPGATKKLPNVPKHCNANDQIVIHHHPVHTLLFCVRRIFSRLYVQYDYMPFYYHHCVKISYLCQAIISYSLHFKFCGSGEKPTGEEKLYSIYLRICLFLPNSCNISISFSSGGASKTLSLFAPRSHLVLYRNRRNVR